MRQTFMKEKIFIMVVTVQKFLIKITFCGHREFMGEIFQMFPCVSNYIFKRNF